MVSKVLKKSDALVAHSLNEICLRSLKSFISCEQQPKPYPSYSFVKCLPAFKLLSPLLLSFLHFQSSPGTPLLQSGVGSMAARNTEVVLDDMDSPMKHQKHHLNTAESLRASLPLYFSLVYSSSTSNLL